MMVVTSACTGCGITQGKLLYMMGFGKGRVQPAEFELTQEGPVLVLVDDFEDRLDLPDAKSRLARQVGDELVSQKAVKAVVPPSKLDRLRQEQRDFDRRGCREVGRMVDAQQVVWLQVRDYLAGEEVEEIGPAARMSVTVKVINALEEHDASKVRLWPVDRDGRIVSAELDATTVMRAKTAPKVSEELTAALAEEVVKLFRATNLDEGW